MRAFRYREDRVPVMVVVLYFALDVAVYFFVHRPWALLVWYLLGIVPKACIGAWNHHHQHLSTFRHAALNRLLEVVYAAHTGMTSHAWVLHHVLGHHRHYLDQHADESAWKRPDGTPMGPWEYSLTIAATAYPRAFRVGLRHPQHLPVFLGMLGVVAALLGCALAHDAVGAVMVFVLPPATALFFTAKATFKHHSGLDTDDPFAASRNIVDVTYNRFTGNLGYHTAHHLREGVHWSRLPALHAQIADRIPATMYIEPGLPWRW